MRSRLVRSPRLEHIAYERLSAVAERALRHIAIRPLKALTRFPGYTKSRARITGLIASSSVLRQRCVEDAWPACPPRGPPQMPVRGSLNPLSRR